MSLVKSITSKFTPPSGSEIMLFHMAHFSDRDLLNKLQRFGIKIDKATLGKMGQNAIALDPVFDAVVEIVPNELMEDPEFDWILACVAELCKRWFPERITFEKLHDRVENVLGLLKQDNVSAAARVWYKTWPLFLRYFELCDITSASEYRSRHKRYEQTLDDISFVADRLAELGGPRHFIDERISFCEEAIEALATASEQDEVVHKIRCLLAESYMTLGHFDKVDGLFMTCLEKDVAWGAAWADWANLYLSADAAEKAELILRDGVAALETANANFSPEIQDERDGLLELLAYSLEKQERWPELAVIRHQLDTILESIRAARLAEAKVAEEDRSTDTKEELTDFEKRFRKKTALFFKNLMEGNFLPKIGRSDPCPCESGSKFKRCCGR